METPGRVGWSLFVLVREELVEGGVAVEAGELLVLLDGIAVMEAFEEGFAEVFEGLGFLAGPGEDSCEAEVHLGHVFVGGGLMEAVEGDLLEDVGIEDVGSLVGFGSIAVLFAGEVGGTEVAPELGGFGA